MSIMASTEGERVQQLKSIIISRYFKEFNTEIEPNLLKFLILNFGVNRKLTLSFTSNREEALKFAFNGTELSKNVEEDKEQQEQEFTVEHNIIDICGNVLPGYMILGEILFNPTLVNKCSFSVIKDYEVYKGISRDGRATYSRSLKVLIFKEK